MEDNNLEGFKVRSLLETDAEQVAQLIWELTENIVKPDKLIDRIKKMSRIKCAPDEGHIWKVVAKNGLVVSFGGLVWHTIASKGSEGLIHEIVTHKDYRGIGLGSMLFDNLVLETRRLDLSQIILTVSDPEAMSIYESRGFVLKGEDVLILRRYQHKPKSNSHKERKK